MKKKRKRTEKLIAIEVGLQRQSFVKEGKFSRSKNDLIWRGSRIVRHFHDSSNIFAKYSALMMKRLLLLRRVRRLMKERPTSRSRISYFC